MSRAALVGAVVIIGLVSAGAAYLVLRNKPAPPPPILTPSPTPAGYTSIEDLYRAENDLNNTDVDTDTVGEFNQAEQLVLTGR